MKDFTSMFKKGRINHQRSSIKVLSSKLVQFALYTKRKYKFHFQPPIFYLTKDSGKYLLKYVIE